MSAPVPSASTQQVVVEVKQNAELTGIVQSVLGDWLRSKDANIFNIISAAMIITEKYNQLRVKAKSAPLTGLEKFQFARELLPEILTVLVKAGHLTQEKHDEINKFIVGNSALISQFVGVAIDISKNPNVIQAQQWVVKQTKSCFPCFS